MHEEISLRKWILLKDPSGTVINQERKLSNPELLDSNP